MWKWKNYYFLIALLIFFSSSKLAYAEEPLPADQAFQLSTSLDQDQTIIATWNVAPGYYLYKSRIHFESLDKDAVLGKPTFPVAIKKTSRFLGNYEVYENSFHVSIPIVSSRHKTFPVKISFQGCSSAGFCYPPISKITYITLAKTPAHTFFPEKHRLWLLLSFFGFGLLIAFTPCLLPMIPILSAIIIGQKKTIRFYPFLLSLMYVLGMAITYAAAGMLFAYLGHNVQLAFQQTWIIALFSFFFLALALWCFGFYYLQLPESLRVLVARLSNKTSHGTLLGTFVMGSLSVLVVSPCVTPPLVAALGYISHTGDTWFGGLALFIMGLGMGLPLLILGSFGPRFLPSTGPWMNAVKNFLGVVLLLMSIWLLSRILPGPVILILLAALSIGFGIYLGALSSSKSFSELIKKCLGLLLFIYGIVLIIGALSGSSNPFLPIHFSQSNKLENKPSYIPVKTINDVNSYLEQGLKQDKIVVLDFYANWCVSCKELEAFTFSNSAVQKQLSSIIFLRADITANDSLDQQLLAHFGVVAPPTVLFFLRGKEVQDLRKVGYFSPQGFLENLLEIERLKNSFSPPKKR